MSCQQLKQDQILYQTAKPWRHYSCSTISAPDNTMVELASNHYDRFMRDLASEWQINFDDLNGSAYDLDPDQNKIVLHNFGLRAEQALASPYFRPQINLALAEAMRMARHVEYLDGRLSSYNPAAVISIGRICVADTAVQKIRFAWNEKSAGNHALWKHILCGDMADLAAIFETSIESYFGNGMGWAQAVNQACASIFNKWYACPDRVKTCDHDTLNLIDNFIADDIEFGQNNFDIDMIRNLTIEPAETVSYLDDQLIKDLLKNPYYSSISDGINQTHFSQITMDISTTRIGGLSFQDKNLAVRFSMIEA